MTAKELFATAQTLTLRENLSKAAGGKAACVGKSARFDKSCPGKTPCKVVYFAAAFFCLNLCLSAGSAFAESESLYDKNGIPTNSFAKYLPDNGDPTGVRKELAGYGVFYTINYIDEIWGDIAGGHRQGAVEDGDLKFLLEADLEKLMGWKGAWFHTIVHDIQGGGIGREFAENLFLVSNIEALPTVRLTALWFEQKFDDKASIRVGQIDADTEFKTSVFAGYFISSTFGWPGLLAVDLPGGGPAYPFAVPGIRLKFDPNKDWTILLGLFDGDPAGPGIEDPQRLNRYGLNFRVNDPPFLTSEIQYRYNQDKNDKAPAGSIKFGAWRQFPFASDNEPVVNPVTGELSLPRRHGDFGFFAILDQQLYRPKGAEPDKGIGFFTRIFVSPDDSNLIDYYADGGLVFSDIISGRPDDAVMIAAAYGHVSDRARSLDEENSLLLGTSAPARDFEALMELSYQAKIADGVHLQPDFQYVWHPGGSSEIKNAVIIGLRAALAY